MMQITRAPPTELDAADDGPAEAPDRAADGTTVSRWLAAFAAAVRAQDYAAGRALFDDDVVSFGTRAAAVAGLDRLVAEQWRHVWGRTRGFDFDPHNGHVRVDGDTAWAAVSWHSQGVDAEGHWFDRYGRATFVLRRSGHGWLAVHSHFSMDPERTAGRLAPR